jgi:hypothetical protein
MGVVIAPVFHVKQNLMNKPFQWKIFFVLWIASIFGVIAVIPYSLALQSGTLQDLELPFPYLL